MKTYKIKNLVPSSVKLAQKLLKKKENDLEELRMHDFPDDESAHDDDLTVQLYAEFSADVEAVQAGLSKEFGAPFRKGKSNSRMIPLNGVFRYAIWQVGDKHLFVAAHHEDRGIPIMMWLGTTGA